ncbi:hypothetical protein BD310DRAFT_1005627 [Dichomitus squalens]|uniref:Uncharacterized protein n=1 Tax=Dichomitus squalens TaxID=114155 RepID=A0A4Q9PE17_9APHY|nr:hypothetical protein BD310DRAFT_1005627 [Dichomitus squalens]
MDVDDQLTCVQKAKVSLAQRQLVSTHFRYADSKKLLSTLTVIWLPWNLGFEMQRANKRIKLEEESSKYEVDANLQDVKASESVHMSVNVSRWVDWGKPATVAVSADLAQYPPEGVRGAVCIFGTQTLGYFGGSAVSLSSDPKKWKPLGRAMDADASVAQVATSTSAQLFPEIFVPRTEELRQRGGARPLNLRDV